MEAISKGYIYYSGDKPATAMYDYMKKHFLQIIHMVVLLILVMVVLAVNQYPRRQWAMWQKRHARKNISHIKLINEN